MLTLTRRSPGSASRCSKKKLASAALLYADGIHDSLYRAAGRVLLTRGGAPWQEESASRAASL
jgi:hypothetical protein